MWAWEVVTDDVCDAGGEEGRNVGGSVGVGERGEDRMRV